MTGPARIAWIIMAVACAWTPCARALAAAPRDAVKLMPSVTHTSDFRISESDDPNSHRYEDAYRDDWRVDWQPPSVMLTGNASLTWEAHYQFTLGDQLDRIGKVSRDYRSDMLNTQLRLDTPQGLRGWFNLLQTDNLSNQYPSAEPRAWRPQQMKQMHLDWTPPGLPSLSADHLVTSTYSYSGARQQSADEVQQTQLQANFQSDMGLAYQRYTVFSELSHSFNRLNEQSGTSRRKTRFDGERQLRFGDLGNLQLAYSHEEVSSRQEPGLSTGSDDTAVSQYVLGLNGAVRNMPLRYNFSVSNTYVDISNRSGSRAFKRQLGLVFTPPVPEGKQAGLSVTNNFSENRDASRDLSVAQQILAWNFSPNKLVSATFRYEMNETNDPLAGLRGEQHEILDAGLSYKIPGGRGSLSGGIHQDLNRKPVDGQSSSNNGLNMNASFVLGPRASLALLYNQTYGSSFASALSLPASTDAQMSGVRYDLNSGQGLRLSATWQQFFRIAPGGHKTNSQTLNLSLSYASPASWSYTLALNTNDESNWPGASGLGYDYSSQNTIEALVTYSF